MAKERVTVETIMPIIFQTTPILARRPVGESQLIRCIRRQPMEAVMYCQPTPMVIDELPDDGFLVVNGEEVTETPLTLTEGDLLIWIPGTVC